LREVPASLHAFERGVQRLRQDAGGMSAIARPALDLTKR
jgi:hypothetical protein